MAGAGFTSYVEWNNQAPLVVIDDTTPEKSVKPSGIQASGAGENSEQLITLADDPTGDTENENRNKTKLCGYLNKYKRGARGIGKIFKRRWFIYSENTCKLLYYRTPQDIVPLGEIDISNATLSFEVGEGNSVGGRTNVFEISSGTRVYYLEAPDQQTMMYWLQQLQAKRRAFSYKKTRDSTDKAQLKTIQQPSAGLVGKNNLLASGDHKDSALLMTPVELPSETIGEGAASSQSKNPLSDISISNWKTELRNALANIRSKRQSDSDAHMSRSPRSLSPAMRNANPSEEKPDNIQKLTRFESFKRRMRTKSQDMDSLGVNLSGSTESLCGRCKQFETAAAQHQEELMGAEEELVATRELVRILQKDIDVEQRQKKTKNAINGNGTPEDQLAVLQAKDKTIVELEHLVATVKEDKEIANVELKMQESKVESLEQELGMYRESLRSKDEIVMSLTNTIFELESSQRSAEKTNAATNTTLKGKPVDALELERLRDAVSAYTLQNKFLNKEILELNKLRADDEARERQLFMKCTQWEAYYYQINSKYLLCLEQLRIPQRGGEGASQEVVTQLLNDAMDLQNSGDYYEDLLTSQSLPYPVSPKRQTKKYDKYGFLVMPRTGEDLVEKAQTLQRKSNELLGKDVDKEITQNIRWENMFVSLGNRELQRTQELKNLIRNGVPYQHKERVWNACISFRVGALRERLGGCYYQNLLDAVDQQSHRHNPALKQIELDLLRTLPNNHHYESMSSDGIPKLKRVLRAYTQHNPDLGYCQGQNRLAAIALLFLNEEDAFWCLLAITEFLMPVDYYSRTLSAAQVDQRVFKDLMLDKMPNLMSHLESQDIDVTLFTFNWFLTIFVDNIPTETYLRVWDSFLYEGNKVLFRFALAFFKYREKEMLAIKDNVGLHNYLRTLGENATDLCKIAQIAFQEVNPLPMRFIEGRRHAHMVQVKNELAELEALRSQFRSSRRNVSHASNDFVSDDET